MDIDEGREFLKTNHWGVLATPRRDGRPQMSPVAVAVLDGAAAISSRETAIKVKNLRRDPHASVCVFTNNFFGHWVSVEGTAIIVSLPEAMDGLVEYYRTIAGEHPDWDDYRAAMEREKRVLIKIEIERAGPNVSG